MLDPPSPSLMRWLSELRLCTPRDLSRCRSRVRALTRDLPSFDSVWIDALQRLGRLTRFQAAVLGAGNGERLQVGPCVLVDRLGPVHGGRTFLARVTETDDPCVLKLVRPEREDFAAVRRRLTDLAERTRGRTLSHARLPRAVNVDGDRLAVLSSYVDGPDLAELLVRRGRFPSDVVEAVARQLAESLSAIETAGLVHGDVRSHNVRLTETGRVELVDTGVLPAIDPELRVSVEANPVRYDGTAPEMIGTGHTFDAATDVYAFGCLLWTLLAGRSPFPTGDVIGKLAAHESQDLPALDDIAPETPSRIVEIVRRATRRDPSRRPTFGEIVAALGRTGRGDRATLSRFHRSFRRSVPRLPTTAAPSGIRSWSTVAAAMFVLTGLSLTLLDEGSRAVVLSIPGRVERALGADGRDETAPLDGDPAPDSAESTATALPAPDADGVVWLEDETYAAAEISTVGSLSLRARPNAAPVVLVGREPLTVWARDLRIDGVSFRRADDVPSASPVLLLVRAQSLRIENSVFDSADDTDDERRTQRYAVAWKPLDARQQSGRRIRLVNVAAIGPAHLLYAAELPRAVVVENALLHGDGVLLHSATTPGPGAEFNVGLDRITLRNARGLLRFDEHPDEDAVGPTWITARNCVFALPNGRSLVSWKSSSKTRVPPLELTAEASFVTPGTFVAGWRTPQGLVEIDDPSVIVDGLVAGRVAFAGSGSTPSDARVTTIEGPRLGNGLPGADPERLPTIATDAVSEVVADPSTR